MSSQPQGSLFKVSGAQVLPICTGIEKIFLQVRLIRRVPPFIAIMIIKIQCDKMNFYKGEDLYFSNKIFHIGGIGLATRPQMTSFESSLSFQQSVHHVTICLQVSKCWSFLIGQPSGVDNDQVQHTVCGCLMCVRILY